MLKFASLLIFVGVLCAVALAKEHLPEKGETCDWLKRNHLLLGHREIGERFVVAERQIYKERVPSQKIELEETFTAPAGMVITRIQAINLRADGKAGCGFLVSGGPGHNSVTLRFVSFIGKSIKFRLNIFAKQKKQ